MVVSRRYTQIGVELHMHVNILSRHFRSKLSYLIPVPQGLKHDVSSLRLNRKTSVAWQCACAVAPRVWPAMSTSDGRLDVRE
jgi:hypothetical protein